MSYLMVLFLSFFLSHLISFLCSILEAVFLSCPFSYVSASLKERPKFGKSLKVLKENVDESLVAILTLNTAAHTFGAAGVGATVKILYGDTYVVIASIVVTLTMLYFTEMIPKTIGAIYWRSLLPYCVPLIKFMIKLVYPFIISFKYISKLIRKGSHQLSAVSEIEVRSLIEEGVISGVFEDYEKEMVFKVFKMADSTVENYMINRQNMLWIDCNESEEVVKEKIAANPSEIYFLCEGEVDSPLGFVYAADIAHALLRKRRIRLKELVRTPLYAPESAKVISLLETLTERKEKVSFVVDEYGVVEGFVELETILKGLVRDIYQSIYTNKPLVFKQKDGSWVADGTLPLSTLEEILRIDVATETEKMGYHTLAGFCLLHFHQIPLKGDTFIYKGYQFTVVSMQNQRISQVHITKKLA